MVKVSFSSALAHKDVKKDAQTLLPEEQKVSRKWLTGLTTRLDSTGPDSPLASDGAGASAR